MICSRVKDTRTIILLWIGIGIGSREGLGAGGKHTENWDMVEQEVERRMEGRVVLELLAIS